MPSSPLEVARFIARNSKRIGISVAGGALVLLGVAMLVLPGPGILVVALGFAVLGTEYAWAARALERTKHTADRAGRTVKREASKVGQAAGGTVRSIGRRAGRRR